MFSEISELKSIRAEKSKLSERECELSAPMFTDMDKVDLIYRHFCCINEQDDFKQDVNNANFRKKFIFIVLFLFSPSTLAGGKMPKGLRDKISSVTGIAPWYISHNIDTVVFLHQRHRNFRNELEATFNKLMDKIKAPE